MQWSKFLEMCNLQIIHKITAGQTGNVEVPDIQLWRRVVWLYSPPKMLLYSDLLRAISFFCISVNFLYFRFDLFTWEASSFYHFIQLISDTLRNRWWNDNYLWFQLKPPVFVRVQCYASLPTVGTAPTFLLLYPLIHARVFFLHAALRLDTNVSHRS